MTDITQFTLVLSMSTIAIEPDPLPTHSDILRTVLEALSQLQNGQKLPTKIVGPGWVIVAEIEAIGIYKACFLELQRLGVNYSKDRKRGVHVYQSDCDGNKIWVFSGGNSKSVLLDQIKFLRFLQSLAPWLGLDFDARVEKFNEALYSL